MKTLIATLIAFGLAAGAAQAAQAPLDQAATTQTQSADWCKPTYGGH